MFFEAAVAEGSQSILLTAMTALVCMHGSSPGGNGGVFMTPFGGMSVQFHQRPPEASMSTEIVARPPFSPCFQKMNHRMGIFVGDRRKEPLFPHRPDHGGVEPEG